jgi:hypothetical protein
LRHKLFSSFLVVLLTTGCAFSGDDGALPMGTGSAKVNVTATPTSTSSATNPTTPLPTTLDSDSRIPLTSYAVLNQTFGTEETTVLAALQAVLGEPTNRYSGLSCDAEPGAVVYQSAIIWGQLVLSFRAVDTRADSHREFVGWRFSVPVADISTTGIDNSARETNFPNAQQVEDSIFNISVDGMPVIRETFVELQNRYPDATMLPAPWEGAQAFVTASGVRFLGAEYVEFAYAGQLMFCD